MKTLAFIDKTEIAALRKQNELLKSELTFAKTCIKQLEAGQFDVPENHTSEVGGAIDALRNKLEQLMAEEGRRHWFNEGVAKFSEILNTNLHVRSNELFDLLIRNLVQYVKANQGGIFLLDDVEDTQDNQTLSLIACYAFNRKKFLTKQIAVGEGLVGQCFLEQESIYLTQIPDDYVQITSGLGEARPRMLLLVPMIHNEHTVGVIELASFSAFSKIDIEFIEKVAENMASAYENICVRDKTSRLLQDSVAKQTLLQTQEEVLRKQMEEMQATQEELTRIQLEIHAQTRIINTVAIVSKTDVLGNITYVNEQFVQWSKYTREEVMGKNHRFLKSGDQPDEIFVTLWKTIRGGNIWRGEIKNRAKDGGFYWVDAIIAPVIGEDGKPKEYIAQRFVINDKKLREQEMRELIEETQAQSEEIRQNMEEMQAVQDEIVRLQHEAEAQTTIINSIAIVSKTDLQGNITYVNDQFVKWSKYSYDEVIGQNHRILKSGDQSDEIFVDLWKTISKGKLWRGEIKNKAKDGSFYWVDAIIAPVLDERGKPKEYIAQRFVINDKKEKEQALQRAIEEANLKEEIVQQSLEQLKIAQKKSENYYNEMERINAALHVREKVLSITTIVSESDRYGTITSVNDKLCAVSKYSREELIGKPHSIFRHPDMPKDIFRLMWNTIQRGDVFRGVVKNRAKDGTHYWVDATIAPQLDDQGNIIKYVSVRYHLQNDEVAEKLYQDQLLILSNSN
jgi:PAS domain S-box-containing protein